MPRLGVLEPRKSFVTILKLCVLLSSYFFFPTPFFVRLNLLHGLLVILYSSVSVLSCNSFRLLVMNLELFVRTLIRSGILRGWGEGRICGCSWNSDNIVYWTLEKEDHSMSLLENYLLEVLTLQREVGMSSNEGEMGIWAFFLGEVQVVLWSKRLEFSHGKLYSCTLWFQTF